MDKKFAAKKKDIERLQDKEKGIHANFVSSLGENNKFADFLTKVFKKKIKRVKKMEDGGEGERKLHFEFTHWLCWILWEKKKTKERMPS